MESEAGYWILAEVNDALAHHKIGSPGRHVVIQLRDSYMLHFSICNENEVIFQFQMLCMAFIDNMTGVFSYNGEWVDVL